jgi:hypothetical protein
VLERLAIAAVEARESFDTAGEDRTAARDRVCSSWIWLECGGAHRGSIPGLGRIVLYLSARRTLVWCEELYEERTQ